MTKRFFIIDAMAMAFRNFHAFANNQITTSNGVPTSAIYGSAQFLIRLLQNEKPDYWAIATDTKAPTFRHDMYPDYKANRSAMPEDLAAQLPYLERLYAALGCSLIKMPGAEADDIIGTMVKRTSKAGINSFIVSGDKDFMQLIDEHTSLYSPKKGGLIQIVDPKGVEAKFGVRPDQVIDLLAIMGDSSDNVPGVPGIGEKGATNLLQTYGSLDAIYDNLEAITNKRQLNGLTNNRELAMLSRDLVTIKTDLDEMPSIEDLVVDVEANLGNQDLLELFEELEFSRLAADTRARIEEASLIKDAPVPVVDSTPRNYNLVKTRSDLDTLCKRLEETAVFSFDTETTGLGILTDHPIGVSFAVAPGEAYYIPLVLQHLENMQPQFVLETLAPLLQSSKLKVAHNAKFDIQMLMQEDLDVSGPLADTMIAAHLVDATSRSYGLDACVQRYLDYTKIPTSALIGAKGEISMLDVELDKLSEYACEDADYTLRLHNVLSNELEQKGLNTVFTNLEMPLVPILAKMERRGVYIDTDTLEDLSHVLGNRSEELKSSIYELAGEDFNINSPKQLQGILFEKLRIHEELGIQRLKKTKSGFSTDVSVLERMAAHPLPEALLEFRSVSKLKSTYVDTLPKLVQDSSRRIHTSFHQTVTATGRLSSSEPNLQNIPIRSQMGRKIRGAFRASSSDHVIVAADYSQVELRILAHLAEDEALIDAFKRGEDIHSSTAAKIFGLSPNEVGADKRSQAKAINFGIIYGMGPQRLARETGVSMREAKEFIDRYFEGFPGIKRYIDSAIKSAEEKGYTSTIDGRIRPLPEINSSNRGTLANAQNIAVNTPIQGSAADLIKHAMIGIEEEIAKQRFDATMLMQVHDELVFECRRESSEAFCAAVKQTMEDAMNLSVPLVADVGIGQTWLEAH